MALLEGGGRYATADFPLKNKKQQQHGLKTLDLA